MNTGVTPLALTEVPSRLGEAIDSFCRRQAYMQSVRPFSLFPYIPSRDHHAPIRAMILPRPVGGVAKHLTLFSPSAMDVPVTEISRRPLRRNEASLPTGTLSRRQYHAAASRARE